MSSRWYDQAYKQGKIEECEYNWISDILFTLKASILNVCENRAFLDQALHLEQTNSKICIKKSFWINRGNCFSLKSIIPVNFAHVRDIALENV
jgi:hypothetical protein